MNQHDSAGAKPRRIVTKIVLSYVVEGEGEQEHSLTLNRDRHGVTVDGVVWSPSLMAKLAYLDGHGPGHGRPVPRRPARPQDGWRTGRRPAGATESAAATEAATEDATEETQLRSGALAAPLAQNGGDEDCLWLHDQGCIWISLCDNPWPH